MKSSPNGPVYIENADGSVSGVLEDVFDQGVSVVKEVQKSFEGESKQLLDRLLQSKEFQSILGEVDKTARDAVKEESSENALNLFFLAVAGGAIGGMLFRGATGAALAGLLAFYSFSKVSEKPSGTSEKNTRTKKKS